MSRENVDRFVECAEAFNRLAETTGAVHRDDVDGWLGFFDPDVLFEPQQAALQGSYMGRDGARQWLADLAEHYGPGHLSFADLRDLGDRVLALGTLRVTGRGSGIETEVPAAIAATFQDGLITHLKDYGDHDRGLEATGLSE
jgi:ketosteroid isomerase-like protein